MLVLRLTSEVTSIGSQFNNPACPLFIIFDRFKVGFRPRLLKGILFESSDDARVLCDSVPGTVVERDIHRIVPTRGRGRRRCPPRMIVKGRKRSRPFRSHVGAEIVFDLETSSLAQDLSYPVWDLPLKRKFFHQCLSSGGRCFYRQTRDLGPKLLFQTQ